MATKHQAPRPRVGDECWFVTWVYKLAYIDHDDGTRELDHDRHKDRTRRVATRKDAEAIAKEVWPETRNCLGYVSFHPAKFVAYDVH